MANIIFYEKPGCINNTKQKLWLESAGHNLEAVNILEHPWSEETLKKFFGDKPISESFNRTAPVIKSRELDPDSFSEDDALKKMIKDPILIKRPLILIDGETYLQGFDKEKIDQLIGLKPVDGAEEIVKELEKTDLTICPKMNSDTNCDDEKESKEELFQLTPVMKTVEDLGFEVSYSFEDLVFVDHNAFLFKFVNSKDVALYFNTDCGEDDAADLEKKLIETGNKNSLKIFRKGTFTISQKDGEENLDITFFDSGNN